MISPCGVILLVTDGDIGGLVLFGCEGRWTVYSSFLIWFTDCSSGISSTIKTELGQKYSVLKLKVENWKQQGNLFSGNWWFLMSLVLLIGATTFWWNCVQLNILIVTSNFFQSKRSLFWSKVFVRHQTQTNQTNRIFRWMDPRIVHLSFSLQVETLERWNRLLVLWTTSSGELSSGQS